MMKLIPGHGFLPCLAAITTMTLITSAAYAQTTNERTVPQSSAVEVNSGASASSASTSGPQTNASDSTGAFIFRLYETILARAPSAPELLHQTQAVQNGASFPMIAALLLSSSEYMTKFGANAATDGGYISELYQNGLLRQPDPAGLAFYENLLQTGTSRATVATFFANSPEEMTLWASVD